MKMKNEKKFASMKKCAKCQEEKSVEEFSKNKSRKDGLHSECKECNRMYYRNNKERIGQRRKKYYEKNLERIKKFYQEHKEQISTRMRKYYQNNKEQIERHRKQYCQKNQENIKKRTRKYYRANEEYLKGLAAEYYQNNKERLKLRNKRYNETHRKERRKYGNRYYREHEKERREYRQKNIEKMKESQRKYFQTKEGRSARTFGNLKRRAVLASCEINDLTDVQIIRLLEKAFRCAICKRRFNNNGRKKTIDHLVPLSKGGNNTLLNTQVICQSCNSKKKDRDYTKFNSGQILMFVG